MVSWWPLRLFLRKYSSERSSVAESGRPRLESTGSRLPLEARLALYESFDRPPELHLLAASDPSSFVNLVSQRVTTASTTLGGRIPVIAVREIVENLLHADFRGAVISVYPGGNEILIADQGPGIPDKEAAARPGFSTATSEMRRFIKGVGSGLTVAREALEAVHGTLRVEDNIDGGTVVTLKIPVQSTRRSHAQAHHAVAKGPQGEAVGEVAAASEAPESPPVLAGNDSGPGEYIMGPARRTSGKKSKGKTTATAASPEDSRVRLTPRQEKVLALFAQDPELGPSTVAEKGQLSLASAYRDLVALQGLGFAVPVEGGKRRLTDKGRDYLAALGN